MVELRKITEENFLEAFHLRLAPGQEDYVSHPIRSLAQAYVYRDQCQPFGIYAEGRMIGYVMVIYDFDVPEYDIWHMMIDREEQGRGYGGEALDRVIDYIRTKPYGDSDRIALTCSKCNPVARKLYEDRGFSATGNEDEDEIELAMTVERRDPVSEERSRMRRKDREVTDIESILRIVDRAKILHLGLADAGCPYVVPLHYGYEYADGRLVFYMHSALEGHKLDLIRVNPNVCIELESDVETVSGGEEPCRYGAAFASVIARGRAEIVAEEQEKIRGLSLLMKNQTGRDFSISPEMASATEVIKVTAPAFTAKSRPKVQ